MKLTALRGLLYFAFLLTPSAWAGSNHSALDENSISLEAQNPNEKSVFEDLTEPLIPIYKDLEERHKNHQSFGLTPGDIDSERTLDRTLERFFEEIKFLGVRGLSFNSHIEMLKGLAKDFKELKASDPDVNTKEKQIHDKIEEAYGRLLASLYDQERKNEDEALGKSEDFIAARNFLRYAASIRTNMMCMKKTSKEQVTNAPPNQGGMPAVPVDPGMIGNLGNLIGGPLGGYAAQGAAALWNQLAKPSPTPPATVEHERPFKPVELEEKPQKPSATTESNSEPTETTPTHESESSSESITDSGTPKPPSSTPNQTAEQTTPRTTNSPNSSTTNSNGLIRNGTTSLSSSSVAGRSSNPESPSSGKPTFSQNASPLSQTSTGTTHSNGGETSSQPGLNKTPRPLAETDATVSNRPNANLQSVVSAGTPVRPGYFTTSNSANLPGNLPDASNTAATISSGTTDFFGPPRSPASTDLPPSSSIAAANVKLPDPIPGVQGIRQAGVLQPSTENGFINPVRSIGRNPSSIISTPFSEYKPLIYSGAEELKKATGASYAESTKLDAPLLKPAKINPADPNSTYLYGPNGMPEEPQSTVKEAIEKTPTIEDILNASGVNSDIAIALATLNPNEETQTPQGVLEALKSLLSVTNIGTDPLAVGEKSRGDLPTFLKQMSRKAKPTTSDLVKSFSALAGALKAK